MLNSVESVGLLLQDPDTISVSVRVFICLNLRSMSHLRKPVKVRAYVMLYLIHIAVKQLVNPCGPVLLNRRWYYTPRIWGSILTRTTLRNVCTNGIV